MEWDSRAILVFPLPWAENLLAWPVGIPSGFRKLCLSLTMGERAGLRAARGCGSSLAQVSSSPVTQHHFSLPCLTCEPPGHVRKLESRDDRRVGSYVWVGNDFQWPWPSPPLLNDPPECLSCSQLVSERNSSAVPAASDPGQDWTTLMLLLLAWVDHLCQSVS